MTSHGSSRTCRCKIGPAVSVLEGVGAEFDMASRSCRASAVPWVQPVHHDPFVSTCNVDAVDAATVPSRARRRRNTSRRVSRRSAMETGVPNECDTGRPSIIRSPKPSRRSSSHATAPNVHGQSSGARAQLRMFLQQSHGGGGTGTESTRPHMPAAVPQSASRARATDAHRFQ